MFTTSGLTKAIQEQQEIINEAIKLSRENQQGVFYIFQKDNEIVITSSDYVKQIYINHKFKVIAKAKGGLFVI